MTKNRKTFKTETNYLKNRGTRVLLDCDGVVADFMGAYFEYHGIVRVYHDRWHCFNEGDPKLTWDMCKEAVESERFWKDMKPMRTIREAVFSLVYELSADGDVELVVLTSPFPGVNMHLDRTDWIKREIEAPLRAYMNGRTHYRSNEVSVSVVLTSAKHLVPGDIMIEDKVDNVSKFLEHNPEGCAIVIGDLDNYDSLYANWDRVLRVPECIDVERDGEWKGFAQTQKAYRDGESTGAHANDIAGDMFDFITTTTNG